MKWIESNKKLPNTEAFYYCTDSAGNKTMVHFYHGHWHSLTGHPVRFWLDETTSACSPEFKSAVEVLSEYGINTMSMDDNFNSQLLHAMEEYANQFKSCSPEGAEEMMNKICGLFEWTPAIGHECLKKEYENPVALAKWINKNLLQEYASINQEGQDEIWESVRAVAFRDEGLSEFLRQIKSLYHITKKQVR